MATSAPTIPDIGQAVEDLSARVATEINGVAGSADSAASANAAAASAAAGPPAVDEIESLCMRCHEQGTTRLLLTRVPHFRELVIMAFECPHCNESNNEVQFAGSLQPTGVRFSLSVPVAAEGAAAEGTTESSDADRDVDSHVALMNRQVVKSDSATIRIPEIDFEIPPESQRGTLTTVEGVLTRAHDGLGALQTERRAADAAVAAAIDEFLAKLKSCIDGSRAFTLVLDDPSGNSYVENPRAPEPDPILKVEHYERTPEQNEKLGFLAAPAGAVEGGEAGDGAGTGAAGDPTKLPHGSVGAELAYRAIAGGNNADLASNALLCGYSAPEEVMVFPATCSACGASGAASGGASGAASGATGDAGRRMGKSLKRIRPFEIGDSAPEWQRSKWQELDKQLRAIAAGEPVRVKRNRATDAGAGAAKKDRGLEKEKGESGEEVNGQVQVEEYVRSWEQDEELGLHDMRTGEEHVEEERGKTEKIELEAVQTATHPWRGDDDVVLWNAASSGTNRPNGAPRGIHAKAARLVAAQRVSEPLSSDSARSGGADGAGSLISGSHATPRWNRRAAASRHVATAEPQRLGGVSRHDGSGGAVVNSAFRAASPDDVAIHHLSSHERRRRGSGTSAHKRRRSSGAGMNNGPGMMATSQASQSHFNGDMRGEFRKAGPSDVVLHMSNGGSNRNKQGVNDHEIVGMAGFAQNGDYSGGDYSGGDYSGGSNGGDYNGGDNSGDNGGDNGGDYNGGGDYHGGVNSGDYRGGDISDFVAVDSVGVNGEGCPDGGNGGNDKGGNGDGGNGDSGNGGSGGNGDGGNGSSGNGGSGRSIDITGILEAAAAAQDWANQLASKGCPLEHGGAEGFGQNLYWKSPAGLTPQEDRGAVQSWVEEKADWTPSPIPDGCAEGKMCGHYTQVVWRDTTHVGCASAQCPDGSGIWVCGYLPPGNFVGQTPY
ncbi:unnamed protein product [Closterium sp. Yama58-4]|nr:unnamed protein product [Closterium sp. Yama58-4]